MTPTFGTFRNVKMEQKQEDVSNKCHKTHFHNNRPRRTDCDSRMNLPGAPHVRAPVSNTCTSAGTLRRHIQRASGVCKHASGEAAGETLKGLERTMTAHHRQHTRFHGNVTDMKNICKSHVADYTTCTTQCYVPPNKHVPPTPSRHTDTQRFIRHVSPR